MSRLGDFGTPVGAADDPDTFGWYGTDLRVNPEFGMAVFVDLMEELGGLDETDPRMVLAVKQIMRATVHDDDFDQFWSLSKKNRTALPEFMQLVQGIVEVQTDRPTGRPAESSDGPKPKTGESTVSYLRRVTDGRPDLEAGLVETLQARGELPTG